MREKLIFAEIVGFLLISCNSGLTENGQAARDNKDNSELSSITMNLPKRENLPPAAMEKLDGYRLEIMAKDSSCPAATNLNSTLSWTNSSISKSIIQGCDYWIILELGNLDETGKSLKTIYFSNEIDDPQGQLLQKEDFQGKKTFNFKIILKITKDGINVGLGQSSRDPQNSPLVVDSTLENDPEHATEISSDFNFLDKIIWTEADNYEFSGETYGSPIYLDVMTHTPDDQHFLEGNEDYDKQCGEGPKSCDPDVITHETKHGLSSVVAMANENCNEYLYYENGKGACIKESKMDAAKIKNYLSQYFLTNQKFYVDLYLGTQLTYFPHPVYQFEEWNAYIKGHQAAIEVVKDGKWNHQDHVFSITTGLEAFYVCSAAILALKNSDPEFLKYEQFKAAYAMQAEATIKLLNEGMPLEQIGGEETSNLKKQFFTSPDERAIRDAIKEWMGAAWTKRVLGY